MNKKEIKEKLTNFIFILGMGGFIVICSLYFTVIFIAGFALFGYQSNLALYISFILGSSFMIILTLIASKNVNTATNEPSPARACLSRRNK